MRILISNDDGLYSEGLDILVNFARTISDDVWVVVPDRERSACGHGITVNDILKISKVSEKVYTITGTPADCVLMGMHYILKDKRPDLVLSGVNKGRNAGDDVTYSGTISVAREAAMHGIKAIAFSQNYEDSIGLNFNCTRKWIAKTFNFIESYNCTDSFLNINFPDINSESEIIKGIKIVPQGRKRRIDSIKRSLNTRNEEYFWLDFDLENDDSNENSDIDAILDKYISITPISINFTQHDDLKKMQEMYGEKIDL